MVSHIEKPEVILAALLGEHVASVEHRMAFLRQMQGLVKWEDLPEDVFVLAEVSLYGDAHDTILALLKENEELQEQVAKKNLQIIEARRLATLNEGKLREIHQELKKLTEEMEKSKSQKRERPDISALITALLAGERVPDGAWSTIFEVRRGTEKDRQQKIESIEQFDATRAIEEGWSIFSVGGNAYQLQRLDEAEVFKSDEDAWKFVWDKAQEGSFYHQSALNFIHENSPLEWSAIERHVKK